MALDPNKFIIAPNLQQCFLDKDTGLPLSGGWIVSKHDNDRSTNKALYTYSGTPTPTYVELPNPLQLDMNGCIVDTMGNSIVPYYYSFDEDGNPDFYFLQVYSNDNGNLGVLQLSREHWPQEAAGGGSTTITSSDNYIDNGQFLIHFDVGDDPNPGQVIDVETALAPPFWNFRLSENFTSVNIITWERYGEPITVPESNPQYAFRLNVQSPSFGESEKLLYFAFPDVNFLQDTDVTFQFEAISNIGINTDVQIIVNKNYGTGGSPSTPDQFTITTFTITPIYGKFNISFTIPSNAGKIIGLNNDSRLEIGVRFPINAVSDTTSTNFLLALGTAANIIYPNTDQFQDISEALAGSIILPNPDKSDYGSSLVLGETIIENGIKRVALNWQPSSIKNLIPCGNFTTNLWQSFVSADLGDSTTHTRLMADRFVFSNSSDITAEITVSRSTEHPTYDEAKYITSHSFEVLAATAQTVFTGDPYAALSFTMEGQDFKEIAQKEWLLSFMAQVSLAGVYSISIVNNDQDVAYVTEFVISDDQESKWTLFTLSIPPSPDAGGWNYESEIGIQIRWNFCPVDVTRQATTLDSWYTPIGTAPMASQNQANLLANADNFFRLALVGLFRVSIYPGYQEPLYHEAVDYMYRYYEKSYPVNEYSGQNVGTSVYSFRQAIITFAQSYNHTFSEHFMVNMRNGSTGFNDLTFFSVNGTQNKWDYAGTADVDLSNEDRGSYQYKVTLTDSDFTSSAQAIDGHWVCNVDWEILL